MNQGLSIFDEEPENAGDADTSEEQTPAAETPAVDANAEKTVVIPALPKENDAKAVPTQVSPQSSRPTGPPSAKPPAPPAAKPEDTAVTTRAVPTISPAPRPVPAPPAGPLPVVRKQGYDSTAVDQRLQMLAADHAELTAAIAQHETRSAVREGARRVLSQLDERQDPVVRRPRRPRLRHAPARGGGGRGDADRGADRRRRDPRAGRPGRPGDQGRGEP